MEDYQLIKQLRKQAGMSKMELHKQSGVSRPTIDAFEKNKHINLDSKIKLFRVFNYRLSPIKWEPIK